MTSSKILDALSRHVKYLKNEEARYLKNTEDFDYIQKELASKLEQFYEAANSESPPSSNGIGPLNKEDEKKEVSTPKTAKKTASEQDRKKMLKAEYRRKTYFESVKKILEERLGDELTVNDIAQKMVTSKASSDEVAKFQRSLAAELRRGAKEGEWKKTNSGYCLD